MKILWLTNKVIPAVAAAMGQDSTLVNEGWLSQMFNRLTEEENIEMTIVCCGANENKLGRADGFLWFAVKEDRNAETTYSEAQTRTFANILRKVKPDVIHAWGSEYPHTLAMALAAKECGCADKMVISLQGIISYYSYYYYYYAGLSDDVVKSRTLYDLLRKTGLENQQHGFAKRGKYEIAALHEVSHVIGRTEWDKHCAMAHNPDLHYHFCNETLRKEFYDDVWDYQQCEKHSIFVSQATYPIKGLHILLEALPKVIEKYPDTKVYVAGADIRGIGSIKNRLTCSAYGRFLRKSIKAKKLESYIHFCGRLNAEKMKEKYLQVNAFVSCSSIENSPNSVGEAMLLGVPAVSSDVGGVRSVFSAPAEGWTYRWDEPQQLANAIIEIFEDADEASIRAAKARDHALKTHNAEENYKTLCSIYKKIYNG